MGICESGANTPHKNNVLTKKRLQPFHAPIHSEKAFQNLTNNNGLSILSQTDIMSYRELKKEKPIVYKYKSTYGKNDEQTTLMTESLYNSMSNIREVNSKNNINSIDETLNESSSQVFEFISDGKMDKSMVKKSNDKTTIDNYIEYIDNKEEDIKNSKVDINNIYQNKKKYK